MTTHVIDDTSIGTVIAGPGVVSRIEVTAMPAQGWAGAIGPLTLTDNSGKNPRQLFNAGADNIGRIAGRSLATARGGLGFAETLSAYPIAFGSLLISSVPAGASFELVVQI
jgi:hypothetical protein